MSLGGNLLASRTDPLATELPPRVGREFERHFTVKQVSEVWALSEKVVRGLFKDEPDVVVIGNTTSSRYRREYKTIRIPESVLARVHQKLRHRQ